mmetsp:Transcript_20935/g.44182  ORF Transcript_20935/g.44182 Transcript_20935/m.44182 type:complete len:241 (+) Transcript_20935:315-1037(+)
MVSQLSRRGTLLGRHRHARQRRDQIGQLGHGPVRLRKYRKAHRTVRGGGDIGVPHPDVRGQRRVSRYRLCDAELGGEGQERGTVRRHDAAADGEIPGQLAVRRPDVGLGQYHEGIELVARVYGERTPRELAQRIVQIDYRREVQGRNQGKGRQGNDGTGGKFARGRAAQFSDRTSRHGGRLGRWCGERFLGRVCCECCGNESLGNGTERHQKGKGIVRKGRHALRSFDGRAPAAKESEGG